MQSETVAIERALGAVGGTFRLTRLYPAAHPVVVESLRQLAAALPGLAALGTVEWKVGAGGLHWRGHQILPRNAQLAELAELLFARGVRGIQAGPGVTPEQWLVVFDVAQGTRPADDPALGSLALMTGRRSSAATIRPAAAAVVAAGATMPGGPVAPERVSAVFRPDALPPDVEARRLTAALRDATDVTARRAAARRLAEIAPALAALRDPVPAAETVASLDAALRRLDDPEVLAGVGAAAEILGGEAVVHRMVERLGEERLAPAARGTLVAAVGALALVAGGMVVDACRDARPELREPYRAAMRTAGDRALEPLAARLRGRDAATVAVAVELLGCSGEPAARDLVAPLARHETTFVREAALDALAALGGREIVRAAVPALWDPDPAVRLAAARAVGVAGDDETAPVLERRLEQETDEGVLAGLLVAVGRVGAPTALNALARFVAAGEPRRRSPHVRAAAIAGLAWLRRPEARALIELHRQDTEPSVRRAAEAALT